MNTLPPYQAPPKEHRSGVVAVIGPPNAGKSTLLNRYLEQKIAIVTPLPQTTRNRILGIVTGPDFQIIMPFYPSLKYQIMQMKSSSYYVGMATGFALPYGAYYVADKYFNITLFDLTVHTGVATKLTTYHVFTGLTFTFGNRLNDVQRGFNLEMLLEAAWGGSLKE